MKLRNKKILITCGPTWIPIDDVRVMSNISSGKLGQMIALELARSGAQVHLLEGAVEEPLNNKSIKVTKFRYYDELLKLIKQTLRTPYDVIIHAAAVSDYELKKPFKGKVSSALNRLTITLVPTQKIINFLKPLNPKAFLVGFKLLPTLDQTCTLRSSRPLFQHAQCDLVVANSLRGGYSGLILDPQGKVLSRANSRESLAKALARTLTQYV